MLPFKKGGGVVVACKLSQLLSACEKDTIVYVFGVKAEGVSNCNAMILHLLRLTSKNVKDRSGLSTPETHCLLNWQ